MKVLTYHIADNIDVKKAKKAINGKIISETNSEIFIEISKGQYMSAYEYGSVAFTDIDPSKALTLIDLIKDCCQDLHTITTDLTEDINIQSKEIEEIEYDDTIDTLYLPNTMKISNKVVRIVMFDLSQTVALDYYNDIGSKLLVDVKKFAKELETTGKLNLSNSNIMKFIGKSLNVKNNIVDTLYIFDSPDMTWNDADSSTIHVFLNTLFDIKSRYREIETLTQVIGDNLSVYQEISHQKKSSTLEIVVIILILIEILQSFAHKMFENKSNI